MAKFSFLMVGLMLLTAILTACTPGVSAISPSSTDPALSNPTAPAQPAQATAVPAGSSSASFVIFDKAAGQFLSYAMDGSLRYKAPATGLEYPDAYTSTVVKDAVYYAPNGIEKPIIRASAAGAKKLNLTVEKLSAFRVSPDEKWISWSTFAGDTNPPSSQLWIARLDGNGGVVDAKQVASYNMSQSPAFWLVPFQWSDDSSQLFFERSLSGLGGYILFGSRFSLYSYNTVSEEITTYITAEENRGMCVDSFRLDLEKVTLNCGKSGGQISVHSLKDGSEIAIPALAEQGAAGGAEFSPSGQWLAYAVARNNPDDEAGQVAVISGDLSGEPKVIYRVDQKRYAMVQGWVDENTLLVTVTNNAAPGSTVLSIQRDGANAAQLATGFFIGWVK